MARSRFVPGEGSVTARSFTGLALLIPLLTGTLPRSLEDILAHAQQLIERGDLGAAQSELSGALETYPQDADLHNLLGVVEAQQGNYLRAESAFRRAIEERPWPT